MSISVNEIRKDFPLLENQKVIYLDTAATSQKPVCVHTVQNLLCAFL